MEKLNLLDCTFRDGGYYTKWNFDDIIVKNYLKAIDQSNIDAIEIGFRHTPKKEELGMFAYSTDEFLSSLDLPSCKIAVMVNASDFISYDNGPAKCVNDLFVSKEDSPVDLVRIAARIDKVNASQSIAEELKKKGYMTTINIMQIAHKKEEDILRAVESIKKWGTIDILYYADSFGSMDKQEVDRVSQIIKQVWEGETGFHAHNNKGNGLSNAHFAIENGTNWIDGTVAGMGRGAGNAQMDQLLIDIGGKYKSEPLCLFHVNDFAKLHDQYGWGPNIYYHLSATNEIHPTYVQKLLESNMYDKDRIISGIHNIKKSNKSNSFDKDVLSISMIGDMKQKGRSGDMNIKIIIPARYKSSRFPGKALVDLRGKSLVQRVWERCCMALPKEDVYVATEDISIKEHCESKGIQVVMTTDKCLTGTDRVYEASLNIEADLFVNVQGDEPLVSPEDILKVIDAYRADPSSVYSGMCPISSEDDFRSPSVPKVVTKDDNELLYMSRAGIPTNKQLGFENGMKQVCIYAFPKNALEDFGKSESKSRLEQIEDIEILRFFELGYNIKMVPVSQSSIAVDFPKDVERVEKAIKEYEAIYG
jgi:3-deoxy-manno-octulosonate cytidylyltransferase (CMP-KDO synthetase)